MDQYFMELMLKQEERGNKQGNTFTKQAWTDMLALFNARFISEYNKRVLRHRYKKLWKYYSDITTLTNQKGFCWDEKQEMVVADDDVWEAYIKVYDISLICTFYLLIVLEVYISIVGTSSCSYIQN